MNQPLVESPCVRNCCLDDEDICLGCFRSLAEITRWSTATEDKKRMILTSAKERKQVAQAKCKPHS